MPRFTIDTKVYERSHGRKPRGRGSWAFTLHDLSTPRNDEVALVFAPNSLSYADAKKWARGHVNENFDEENRTGHLGVSVAP